MSSLLCNVVSIASRSWFWRFAPPPAGYICLRGKKKQAKSKKQIKKDLRRLMMKEYLKKLEMAKVAQETAMKAARKGDPLDPEMLNPTRKRPPNSISKEEREQRFLLVKDWTQYCMEKHKQELQFLHGLMKSRDVALNELKKVSFGLYVQALELNPKLFPFERQGPTATPRIPGYEPPELES